MKVTFYYVTFWQEYVTEAWGAHIKFALSIIPNI